MKRLQSKAGFSLMEMLVTIVILLLLTAGIGYSMDVGSRIYRESVFESHSALLAETLNNSLNDILGNSTKAWALEAAEKEKYPADVNYAFNNPDYGATKAYIALNELGWQILKIYSPEAEAKELVNTGAYPDLEIADFQIQFYPRDTGTTGSQKYGGYFTISYVIRSSNIGTLSREVQTVVRLVNNP